MKYRVQISQLASEQIDEAYLWLAQQTEKAWAWHEGLMDAIASLEENPLRCPHIPEDEDFLREARHLLYGGKRHAYRIIFEVAGDVVTIMQIRHGARKGLR